MTAYAWCVLLIGFLTTFTLRATPFILFDHGKGGPPKSVQELGRLISPAAIAMLVAYCYFGYYKNFADFMDKYLGVAEWTAGLVVVVVQLLWKNPLASILSGTVLYMVIVQYWL